MSPDLINQAMTYGRALFSVAPFRQFALVLGYDHEKQQLYFLVFHCGGVTISEVLSVQNASHRKEILRLFLSILTWKTPGDAGFKEWFGALGLFIPRYPVDTEGVFLHVMEMLFKKDSPFGRSPLAIHCMTSDEKLPPLSLVPVVNISGVLKYASLVNDPQTLSQAHVDRMDESESSVGESGAHPPSSSSRKRSSGRNAEPEVTKKARLEANEARFEPIVLKKDEGQPVYVPQKIKSEYMSCNIPADKAFYLVLKMLWLPVGSDNVESKLLKACGGMLGVVEHYYSSALSHKPGVLSTNHLFLPNEAKPLGKMEGREKDRRVLWLPALNFAGESLVKAGTSRMLIASIIHTIFGHRNILFKGYQHRDISIGNVLFRKKPVKNLVQNLKETKAPNGILELVARLGINDDCNGCVIDGDLAILLTSYFRQERKTCRFGTKEFMPQDLLEFMINEQPFLQSPTDDFFSFYFVTQWAAVFNNPEFADPTHKKPASLITFRSDIFGNREERLVVASEIQNKNITPNLFLTP